MRVYVAGPLFTPDERSRLARVAEAVDAAGQEAVLPFEPGDFDVGADRDAVYRSCVDAVAAADAIVAVLDGVDVDSGTAYEVGYARSRGAPVLGIRTDYRTLGPEGPVNTMLARGVTRLARPGSPDEEAEAVRSFLEDLGPGDERGLVRDDVPQMRRRGGADVAVREVDGEERVEHLKRFLRDRAARLPAADDVEEKDLVADLLAGVEALAAARGLDPEALRRIKEKREEEFGGLEEGRVIESPIEEEPP
jgi:nucleoside 2-deoxyribosyltransferase/predicted house-cleaning noncanonical NTP pyrophosphatase (MazG superfamily)